MLTRRSFLEALSAGIAAAKVMFAGLKPKTERRREPLDDGYVRSDDSPVRRFRAVFRDRDFILLSERHGDDMLRMMGTVNDAPVSLCGWYFAAGTLMFLPVSAYKMKTTGAWVHIFLIEAKTAGWQKRFGTTTLYGESNFDAIPPQIMSEMKDVTEGVINRHLRKD